MYKGLAWLFLGVANTDALLYDDEWQEVWHASRAPMRPKPSCTPMHAGCTPV